MNVEIKRMRFFLFTFFLFARGSLFSRSFLVFDLLFFVFTRAGMQVGARGVIAPWLAGYAPTAIALLAGLALLWRAQRRGVA